MATGVSGIRSLYATFLGFVIGSVGRRDRRHLARYIAILQPAAESLYLGIQCYIWAFNALPKVALDHVIDARAASGGA